MDFIDDAVTKAKEAFDVACKKTNEVVTTQKQKFDIASLEAKRTKDFEALGRFYYSELKESKTKRRRVWSLRLMRKTQKSTNCAGRLTIQGISAFARNAALLLINARFIAISAVKSWFLKALPNPIPKKKPRKNKPGYVRI